MTLMASQLNTTCGNNTFEMFGFDDFLSCFRRGSCCSGALRRLLERRRVLGCADRAGPGYRQGCIRADGLWSQHEAVVGAFGCWQAFQAEAVLEFNHEASPRGTYLAERPDVRSESSLGHRGARRPARCVGLHLGQSLAVNLEANSVCFSAEAQSPCHFFVKFRVNSWHQPLCSFFWPRLSILVRLDWGTHHEHLFVRAPKQGAPME